MAKLFWFLGCDTATVDQQTNQITLVNVREQITVPKLPAFIPKITLVALWGRESKVDEAETITFRIRMKTPSGKFHEPMDQNLKEMTGRINKGLTRLRSIIVIGGIPLEEEGLSKFTIEIKRGTRWFEVGSTLIHVKLGKISY